MFTRIKDGKELKGGINGELHMGNLQQAHSGLYSCRVETSAGITTSKEAKLDVKRMFYIIAINYINNLHLLSNTIHVQMIFKKINTRIYFCQI